LTDCVLIQQSVCLTRQSPLQNRQLYLKKRKLLAKDAWLPQNFSALHWQSKNWPVFLSPLSTLRGRNS